MENLWLYTDLIEMKMPFLGNTICYLKNHYTKCRFVCTRPHYMEIHSDSKYGHFCFNFMNNYVCAISALLFGFFKGPFHDSQPFFLKKLLLYQLDLYVHNVTMQNISCKVIWLAKLSLHPHREISCMVYIQLE